MKYVLITGVSSGIGLVTAIHLAKNGYYIFGSVRSERDAKTVKKKIGEHYTPLIFDVTEPQAIEEAALLVKKVLGESNGLTGLINNAGISVSGPLMHVAIEDVERQFHVNVFGVLRVTQAFLPSLGARKSCSFKPGRIINISSISGRLAFPFIGPYVASKHALEAMSDVLRRELMLYGIDVILIEPGNTDTPIWDKARHAQEWQDTDYSETISIVKKNVLDKSALDAIPPEKVARLIHRTLVLKRPDTRYMILKHKILGWHLPRLLSDRSLDTLIAKKLKLI